MSWQTLSDTTRALTQVRLYPAGGLELRRLAIDRTEGYCLALTIDEVNVLRQLLTDPEGDQDAPPPLSAPSRHHVDAADG